jgi:NADPH:quinone reductase-like Zn-dependent oxidoreductase
LQFLKGLLESGELAPVIDSTLPLSAVPAAMQRVADGSLRGKLVISVAG